MKNNNNNLYLIYKDLRRNSNTQDGSIKLISFLSVSMMLFVHLIFLVVYILTKNIPLFFYDLFSIFVYLYFLYNVNNHPRRYYIFTFSEIYLHVILATTLYGWTPGFHFWFLAMICALNLPIHTQSERQVKLSFHLGLVFIATFYILAVLFAGREYSFQIPLGFFSKCAIYTLNTFITFTCSLVFIYFNKYNIQRVRTELTRKADFDQLTNLYNRYAIRSIMESKIRRKEAFSLAIIDIDFFKKINDTYGHNVGDVVLIELSNALKDFLDKDFSISRWGGEEFIVLTSKFSYKEFTEKLDNLRDIISKKEFKIDKNIIKFTISIGTYKYSRRLDIDTLIDRADQNLYKAKETGRNKLIS